MLLRILCLVFFSSLCSASSSTRIYLHPPITSGAHLSGPALLAYHLGLEAFEHVSSDVSTGDIVLGTPQAFVGKGLPDALLVSVDTNRPEDVLPAFIKPSFTLPITSESVSSLLSRYEHRARGTYHFVTGPSSKPASIQSSRILDIFSLSSSTSYSESRVLENFLTSLHGLVAFVDEARAHEAGDRFGAFEVKGLNDIEEHWGRQSELYMTATATLKATMESAVLKDLSLALLFPSNTITRQLAQPPQSPFPAPKLPDTAPIFSTSTCYSTADTCRNATASCSSRGNCVSATRAGRTCFVCQCGKAPLEEGGKNISWAGNMCQKKDISQQFTLIVGTVLFLVLISVGSISLLYTIGDQELPGTLTGGLGGHSKHV